MRLAFALCLLLAAPAQAEDRPQGLMWNRSGLPLTLPLQVVPPGDADMLLLLQDPATGKAVLSAYIRSGAPARVLVPPGVYDLSLATGTDWQGEEDLFGPGTRRITLDQPLAFTATMRRKSGHLIDLRDPSAPAVRAFGLCQRLGPEPDGPVPDPAQPPEAMEMSDLDPERRFDEPPRLDEMLGTPVDPLPRAALPLRRSESVTVICD